MAQSADPNALLLLIHAWPHACTQHAPTAAATTHAHASCRLAISETHRTSPSLAPVHNTVAASHSTLSHQSQGPARPPARSSTPFVVAPCTPFERVRRPCPPTTIPLPNFVFIDIVRRPRRAATPPSTSITTSLRAQSREEVHCFRLPVHRAPLHGILVGTTSLLPVGVLNCHPSFIKLPALGRRSLCKLRKPCIQIRLCSSSRPSHPRISFSSDTRITRLHPLCRSLPEDDALIGSHHCLDFLSPSHDHHRHPPPSDDTPLSTSQFPLALVT